MRIPFLATMLELGCLLVGCGNSTRALDDAVPNEETAVRIAQETLASQGSMAQQELQDYRPWHATLVGKTWQVRGTLPKNTAGGTYVVFIEKADGHIAGIFHEQ